MPNYDYVCDSCGHELELFQSMSDSPRRKCPECARLKLQRRIGGGAAVIFKGSGFYQTDYRSASYRKGVESARKEKQSSAEKSSTSKADKPKKSDAKKSPSASEK